MKLQIVSGGQSGVDRGALDGAIESGVSVGGWCPVGRMAEDGTIPLHYPLREAPRPGYGERTLRNVLDSDGTLIIYFGQLSGGTQETLLRCLQTERPYQLIDAREISTRRAAEVAADFVRSRGIGVLNVAGPRASHWPEGYDYTYRVVREMCTLVE